MVKTVLIKKYENRRLYDVTNSRYVNLDDVARILKQGDNVRVVDATSGDDITRLILTQIIVEGAKEPDSGFPLDILREMVIASGRVGQESAMRYTQAMLELYKSTYRAISPALNPFEFMQPASPGAAPFRAQPQPEPPANPDDPEVVLLKHRLEELEKQVSAMKSEKSATGAEKKNSKGRPRTRRSNRS